jgi:hypothetical protein
MALLNHGPPPPTSAAIAREASKRRRRLVRRLLGDLAAFTGVAVGELAATTPKAPRRQSSRITYRKNLTDADLDALVAQIGLGRWWNAFERATRPGNGNGGRRPPTCSRRVRLARNDTTNGGARKGVAAFIRRDVGPAQ